jgi:ABC-type Fe3+-hydroxamate transport system substrate-binding protein
VRVDRLCAALLAAALLALALGCQESGFDERKETARPLKVQHVLGETKVPGQAVEPLTLTLDALDDTLALGVRPAGAAVPDARLPEYLRRAAAGVSLVQSVTADDLAAVEGLQADLIIGADGTPQARLYDDLSRIAPTVIRAIRRASGNQGSARSGSALRVAVARVTADGLRFASRDSFAGTILADAGVTQVTRDSPNARIDVILLSKAPGAPTEAKRRPRVRRAAENVDDALWSGPGGATAAEAALDDLATALAR